MTVEIVAKRLRKIFFDSRRQDQRLAHHLPRRQGDHDLGRSRRSAGGCGRHRIDRRAAGGRHIPGLAGEGHPRDLGQPELAVDHLRPPEDCLAVSEFDHRTRQAAAHRSARRSRKQRRELSAPPPPKTRQPGAMRRVARLLPQAIECVSHPLCRCYPCRKPQEGGDRLPAIPECSTAAADHPGVQPPPAQKSRHRPL